MTNTNFTTSDLSFDVLFNNGTCLTFNALEHPDNYNHANKLDTEYCKKHKVKNTIVETISTLDNDSLHSKFHYFSNGVIIYNFYHTENINNCALKRILKMLEIRKLPVNKIYDLSKVYDYVTAYCYMEKLKKFAQSFYPIKDTIKITELPSIENFVKECYANGNILLSASKDENIDHNIRKNIALFADGRFYISNNINFPAEDKFFISKKFKREHDDFIFLKSISVPNSYINALYEEAKKYDWYISEEEQKQKNAIPTDEITKMNQYIENLFNTRKCLSVINIEYNKELIFSAESDIDKYALFSDGLLIFSDKSNVKGNIHWYKKLNEIYPNLEFKIEIVPDYYIPAIYSALPQYQRSASNIYIELIKERAKKIKKELNIAHHEALDIAAQSEHWKNYKSISIKDEAHARSLISRLARYQHFKDTNYYLNKYNYYLKKIGGKNV